MDAAVGFIGLAVGYGLVSWWLGRKDEPAARPPPRQGPWRPEGPPRDDPPRREPPPPTAPAHWSDVLGVARTADEASVRAAWRSRIAQYHPDKVSGMGPQIVAVAERESARINAAWEAAQREFAARG